jgi:hypothetical protein
MPRRAILDESGNVLPCSDFTVWMNWFEHSGVQRQIALDVLAGHSVSTIFHGVDFGPVENPALYFETAILKPSQPEQINPVTGQLLHYTIYSERYETLRQALRGHEKALLWLFQ